MAYLVKSVGYFAHWKVNVNYLDQNEPEHISDTFEIDMWQWYIFSHSLSFSLCFFILHASINQPFLFIPPGE